MKNEILASIMVILLLCTVIAYNVQVEKAEAEIEFDEDELPDSTEDEQLYDNISGPEIRNEFPPNNWAWGDLQPIISVFVGNETGTVIESSIQLFVQDYPVAHQISSENEGYSVSYRHENGFTNGELVRCRLEGMTNGNHHYEYQWKFRTDRNAASFSRDLALGWNLISIPLETMDSSIDGVFGSIEGKFERIYAYDMSGEYGRWVSFSTHRPEHLNDLDSIELSKAYWVYAIENCTLTITGVPKAQNIILHTGWNLVGYPCMDERMISDCLCGTGFSMVEGFDSSDPYYLKKLEDSYLMKTGEGYWVRVPVDTYWTVE